MIRKHAQLVLSATEVTCGELHMRTAHAQLTFSQVLAQMSADLTSMAAHYDGGPNSLYFENTEEQTFQWYAESLALLQKAEHRMDKLVAPGHPKMASWTRKCALALQYLQ